MALRCFVFTSDEGTAALIRQILADLGVEADPCSDAVLAAEKITNQSFQIVIIDWDNQPEAGLLLTTARERKASERALTLAIVSDEKNVPIVLQAGANSILRKPLAAHQAKDTLTTARDLLRAKHDSAAGVSHAAAAAASAAAPSLPSSTEPKNTNPRAGEFLVSAPVTSGAKFETEADPPFAREQSSAIPVEPVHGPEPMTASAAPKSPEPPAPIRPPAEPAEGQTRGLEWYLKTRVAAGPTSPPAPPETPTPRGNPELLGYDQIPAQTPKRAIELVPPRPRPSPPEPAKAPKKDEQKTEAALFAYMDGERAEQPSPSRFHLGKKAIFGAAFLAIIAIAATPQAPWHPQLRTLWQTGQKTVRGWLNPQPVTAVQEAPRAHEELYRPGDEYKLPVAENIPDATTDPSQIEVVPAVDPTAKKPTLDAANPAPTSAAPDTSPTDQPSTQTVPAPEVQPTQLTSTQVTPAPPQPVAVTTAVPASQPKTVTAVSLPPQPTALPVASPAQPKPAAPQPHYVSPTGTVPQSLRSQLAPATPDPVSKPADTGLPSIEPVTVTEAAERALVTDQPTIPYPANAKNQQGTVVLQVLIARDGTVQDAKFLQGSFLFARTAIDGVKQWKFKPYILNGRPVSVQTTMTMKFKPGQ